MFSYSNLTNRPVESITETPVTAKTKELLEECQRLGSNFHWYNDKFLTDIEDQIHKRDFITKNQIAALEKIKNWLIGRTY